MSGGSYDYAYERIQNLADEVDRRTRADQPDADLRQAFAAHLRSVADVAYELEWFDSRDRDGAEWVRKARALLTPTDILAIAVQMADTAQQRLERAIADARLQVAADNRRSRPENAPAVKAPERKHRKPKTPPATTDNEA